MIDKNREALLRDLSSAAPFVVIGSCALGIYAPHVIDRRPRDIDLLVAPDSLNDLAALLVNRGYNLTSWQEPVRPPLPMERLHGRFYLRASKGDEVIDLTYECEPLPFRDAWSRRVVWRGIPLACLVHVTRLMAVRRSDQDRRRLIRLGLTWPAPVDRHPSCQQSWTNVA